MFAVRSPQGKPAVARPGGENVELEEALTALDRARVFGTSKLSLQRLVYVNELVDCAHEIGYEATVVHLLPLVHKLAADPEVQVRQALVGHFGDLAGFLIQSDPERGYEKVVEVLLPEVSLLLSEKASEVRQGAADALATLASHLRPGERGDQVLMMVISLSHNDDDEDARTTAVQLLNGLAEALGVDLCQQFVGVELVALCEDPAFRVRKAAASNFAEVSRMVGDEYVLRRLLPAFGRLVHDGHWGVRKAAAESLVSLAMVLNVDNRQEPFVSLMNDLLKDASKWVKTSAQQQLGYLIAALEVPERVPEELLTQYVEIIEQMRANPDAADVFYHCAFTFAAVTRTLGRSRWPVLQAAFSSLFRDPQAKTRKAMAASVHIVAETLGPELTEQEVLPHLEAALLDSAQEVRMAALRNVAGVLRTVPRLGAQRRLAKALQAAVNKAENAWRPRHLVASQLGAICEALVMEEPGSPKGELQRPVPDGVAKGEAGEDGPDVRDALGSASTAAPEEEAQPKDLVWSLAIPMFLQLCADPVAEVRDEAAQATARALRAAAPELFVDPATSGTGEGSSGCSSGVHQPLPPATSRLVRHLIRTFARGRTFRNRMAYIRMCDSVIRESPLHVFTDLLLRPLVRLSVDKVKNVRLCWVNTVLPHVRKAGRLGQNEMLLGAAARMAKTDEDREVRRVLSNAHFLEMPDGDLPASESDLDDSDKGEGWLAIEGGTGDSS